MQRLRFGSSFAPLLALSLATGVAAAPSARDVPLSPRNASYAIELRLDPRLQTLEGRQVLTWTNRTARATGELWFHLYWNAWRNDRSTWLLEDRLRDRSDLDDVRDEDWGWIDVRSTRLLDADGGELDLTPSQRFEAPDDGNPDDRTVLVVTLPRPVPPGGTIRVEQTWQARVPRTFARTGRRGEFYFIAHGFPKLGVLEHGGWNCHQFHAGTEFYSDYGVYDVRITLPERFVVGATGRRTATEPNGDGTVTHRFQQADVHGFTWTASPDYVVREARFEEPGLPPIELRLLIQPEHLAQAERHLAAARAAFRHYGTWYGPYPYGHVTIVDPAYGSGAGGMEYPTLFTCGTRLYNPFGADSPESVTVHEAGHQFWYGIVGNNEFEHAWLDEGLNTFSTYRTLDAAYPARVLSRRYLAPPGGGRGFLPLLFREVAVSRLAERVNRSRSLITADVPARPSFRYYPEAHGALSYGKPALWLVTLERHLGWDTLQRILSTFFRRHAFGHPTPDDFFAIAEEVSGRELDWFFDQVHRGSGSFDYAVTDVSSRKIRPRGWVERDGELVRIEDAPENPEDDAVPYRSEVVVRRLGDAWFPVDVLLVFEDGHEIRESWDGRDRWRLVVVEREAKLDHAVVDPGHVLALDIDRVNNSRRVERRARMPAVKWGSKWMVWLQDLLAAFEFFL